VVICLERCVDLDMAQLMPLPLTVSCSNKIHVGFTFLVPAHQGGPGQRAVKRVCVRRITRNCKRAAGTVKRERAPCLVEIDSVDSADGKERLVLELD